MKERQTQRQSETEREWKRKTGRQRENVSGFG